MEGSWRKRKSFGSAIMSVFSANMSHRSFVWQMSLLCFVLGLLLAAAVFTANQIARQGVASPRTGFVYGDVALHADKAKEYEKEIKKLRDQNAELAEKVHTGSDASSSLLQELKETKLLAGLTDVTGPGVQVTLMDSQKKALMPSNQFQLSSLIHDTDIATVVNELKASGAEAVAVNGQRVIALTAIRCVGPVVHVNGHPTTPPYVIQAIGDQEAMYGGLNLPSGVLDGLRQFDPNMIRIEKKQQLHIPGFTGVTQPRFAHPTEASRQESSKDKK
jgi:uncharacterized protein YlxW (UPF0749 family)